MEFLLAPLPPAMAFSTNKLKTKPFAVELNVQCDVENTGISIGAT
jgi:hypothetical protein